MQKTAEPIDMPFGLRTRVGPGNHVLHWGPDSHMRKGNFGGKESPIVKYRDFLPYVSCAETAEPIDLPFVLWSRVGRSEGGTSSIARWRQCTHMGGYIGAIWRVRLNLPSAAAMRSYITLLSPLVSCCRYRCRYLQII